MKTQVFKTSILVTAVQAALAVMVSHPLAALADDPTAADQTTLTKSVEVGVVGVSKSSPKFGEYNGLEDSGVTINGGFSLNGGGAYDSDDTTRYHINASNLGLGDRSLSVDYGKQGLYNLSFDYSELLRNRGDQFQSPYLGAGTSNLTLPSNWTAPLTAGKPNALAINQGDINDYQNLDMQTKRMKSSLGLSINLAPDLKVTGNISHETKDGIQPLGMSFNGTSAQATIPDPIHYTTDDVNIGLDYSTAKGFIQGNFEVSQFRDGLNSFNVQDPYSGAAGYAATGQYSTMPSNSFNKISLDGGYNFTNATKLVADASYAQAKQNAAFTQGGMQTAAVLPAGVSSLNGEVDTTNLDLKLTNKTTDKLTLSAAYKYNYRDDKTPSNVYAFADTDLGGATSTMVNLPYSKRLNQADLSADWRFAPDQALGLSYQNQKINLWCDTAFLPGQTGSSGDCVNSTSSNENTVRLSYRNNIRDDLTGQLSYAYANRDNSPYQPNPSRTIYGADQTGADLATRYFLDSRKEDKAHGMLDWQATQKLDLTGTIDYTRDRYDQAQNPAAAVANLAVGLDTVSTTTFDLDAAFQASDTVSLTGFYTRQDMSTVLNGNPCTSINTSGSSICYANTIANANWSINQKDVTNTYGLGLKMKNLMSKKLDIGANLTYSDATSPYALSAASVAAFNKSYYPYAGNTAANLADYTYLNSLAGLFNYPDTYARSLTLTLNARYTIDKKSSVRVMYEYSRLSSNDPSVFSGLQTGSGSTTTLGANPPTTIATTSVLLPTNEQSPNYNVSLLGVAYVYNF